ncbi:proclotting enzyme-like [Leptopilina heterotoma]|uniref:proclotting enzyme-like n=1 Tax=Leptopilina heterotoma TaxID=63436 RepID=UPI001CA823BA|nr:proclotting enzyme-like [Leptopilina heterotoma]
MFVFLRMSMSALGLCIIWNLLNGALSYTDEVAIYSNYPGGHGSQNPVRRWTESDAFLGGGPRGGAIYRRDIQVRPYAQLVRVTEERSDPLTRITETLGALNTVGSYIVNMTRGGDSAANPSKELPSALYTISKNILGKNVTDSIAPIVRGVTLPLRPVQLTLKPLTTTTTTTTTTSTFKPVTLVTNDVVSDLQIQSSEEIVDREKGPSSCTTAEGGPGRCQDLSNCPHLLLDLTKLRQSLCFKSLFVPGVCCPIEKNDIDEVSPTYPPVIQTTTKPRPRPTKPPTPKPIPLFPISTTNRPNYELVTAPDLFGNKGNETVETIDNNFIQDDDECGVRNTGKYRVVGGEESLPGRWPWMAAIYLQGARRTEFWCGGSLIGPKHILTAAHCTRDQRQRPFAARQFMVRLGDIDLERDDEPSSPATYAVKEIHAHQQFSRVGFYNDIAVLELTRPVRKSPYIIPICLPQARHRGQLFAGARPTVVGWGTTYYGGKESTVQRQVTLPVWRNEDCNAAYFQPITGTFLCAGFSQGGKDACQGDSGGPLMLKQEGRWMQIGIVSFGNKCGEPGYPGVYTRVSEYADWIKSNLR